MWDGSRFGNAQAAVVGRKDNQGVFVDVLRFEQRPDAPPPIVYILNHGRVVRVIPIENDRTI